MNSEVQRANDVNHQRRVRYNASVITANYTSAGANFKDIPDVISIFISEFDVFDEGEMLYEIERKIRKSGSCVFNGWSEYYVNSACEDRSTEALSAVSDLMQIFTRPDKYDYKRFPKTSERKNRFKNTEEGQRIMGKEIQDLLDETAAEEQKQTLVQSIKNLMETLKLTLEQAMDALKIPSDERAMYAGMVNGK